MTATLPVHVALLAVNAVKQEPSRFQVIKATAAELKQRYVPLLGGTKEINELLTQYEKDARLIHAIIDPQDTKDPLKAIAVAGNMLHTFNTPLTMELNNKDGLKMPGGPVFGQPDAWDNTVYIQAHKAPLTINARNRTQSIKNAFLNEMKPFEVVVRKGAVTVECTQDTFVSVLPRGGAVTASVTPAMASDAEVLCRVQDGIFVPPGTVMPNGAVINSKRDAVCMGNMVIWPSYCTSDPTKPDSAPIATRIHAFSGKEHAVETVQLRYNSEEGFNPNTAHDIHNAAKRAQRSVQEQAARSR